MLWLADHLALEEPVVLLGFSAASDSALASDALCWLGSGCSLGRAFLPLERDGGRDELDTDWNPVKWV